MNKLTKEQSETLFSAINARLQYAYFAQGNATDKDTANILSEAMGKIRKAIDSCTEKDFPKLEMTWDDKDDVRHFVKIDLEDGEIEVNGGRGEYYLYFGHEEFKEFTKGCISICQWLDKRNE